MKRYKKYKDSGVEWIGDIPEHWEVLKTKYCDKLIMGQSPDSKDYNMNQCGLPFLQGNADFGYLHPDPKIWCETSNKIAETNDILLSVRAPIGAVNIANQRYGIGRGLCSIRSIKSNYKFLYYHFLIRNSELNSIGTGSTYTAISSDEVNNLIIPFPSLKEQTAISNYLDRKTSQIDELISQKKRLVELMEEEKTAIINQAVTKGLDPNVPMKDSGIPWIGEIPEHWEVTKMKYVVTKVGGGVTPKGGSSVYKQNGIPLLRSQNIHDDGLKLDDVAYISDDIDNEMSNSRIQENDVLLNITGASIGRCFYIPKGFGKGNVNQHVWRSLGSVSLEISNILKFGTGTLGVIRPKVFKFRSRSISYLRYFFS
jgi:type I restriction enzyme S subunit